MLRIAIPKESYENETRVAALPQTVKQYCNLGVDVSVERGLGQSVSISDAEYQAAGAKIVSSYEQLASNSDVILQVRAPNAEQIAKFRKDTKLISFLDPFRQTELLSTLAKHNITAMSMEMIPRITRAQKMDALSSQTNLGGYVAVILAAEYSQKAFPMMMTAAGTINPVRVFVIGVGVAGLQAIATAKRLGARVEAFDTRPVVAEQVKSLGAKFVEIDLGETSETKGGYATALTPEQVAKQQQAMIAVCAKSDVVITTAQVFGKPAPKLVNQEMVAAMQPGSVIIDMAIETGGNVDGSVLHEVVDKNGVSILGFANLPGRVALHASQVYANNLYNLFAEYWNKEQQSFNLNLDDEILQACVVAHAGNVLFAMK